MPKKTLPPGAAAEYLAGGSARSLAVKYGISEPTFLRRLSDAGIRRGRAEQRISRMPLDEMVRRYEAGESAKDLMAESGLALQTVQKRLASAGVHIRGPAEKAPVGRARMAAAAAAQRIAVPEDRLRDLHAQGMSTREMAPALGVCEETVRRRLKQLGLPRLPGKARPERNVFWRGGYTVDEQGYILKKVPDHPEATATGYVRLHRLVMERELGRYLLPSEVVDHENGDPSDNDPGNLRLFASNAGHLRTTLTGVKKLPFAERERLRLAAVQRARQRVAAILAGSESGAAG